MTTAATVAGPSVVVADHAGRRLAMPVAAPVAILATLIAVAVVIVMISVVAVALAIVLPIVVIINEPGLNRHFCSETGLTQQLPVVLFVAADTDQTTVLDQHHQKAEWIQSVADAGANRGSVSALSAASRFLFARSCPSPG